MHAVTIDWVRDSLIAAGFGAWSACVMVRGEEVKSWLVDHSIGTGIVEVLAINVVLAAVWVLLITLCASLARRLMEKRSHVERSD